MRRYKKILIALGIVVLLLVSLGVYIGTDETRQRAILVTAVETWIGGTLEMDGSKFTGKLTHIVYVFLATPVDFNLTQWKYIGKRL